MDNNMGFKSQLSKTVSSVNQKIWLLRHFRNHMNKTTAKLLLKTMLLPYIDNSSVFLSGISYFEQKKLQILQNIGIRVSLNVKDPMSVSVKNIHLQVDVLPIDLRRQYLQGILCYRLISLNALDLVQNRVTRAADGPLIKMYISHTRRVQVSPPVDAYNTWNNISPVIRQAESSALFKSKLKRSIVEYFKEIWRYDLQFTNL